MNTKLSTIPFSQFKSTLVLGTNIDACNWRTAIHAIHRWGNARESRYVCLCNAHSLITARHSLPFRLALQGSDLSTPDGMPVTWMMRQLGFPNQQRINGPDLMWHYCSAAEHFQDSIFLYGSSEQTLKKLEEKLHAAFPKLLIAGSYSPPFRQLSADEDTAIIDMINLSGAKVVFVSLGCPKQEIWMAKNRGKIYSVMLGVGAAFDYHAGTIQRAPNWMQQHGLEWLYRLCAEPRRLWKRYVVTNSLFILHAFWQLTFGKKS